MQMVKNVHLTDADVTLMILSQSVLDGFFFFENAHFDLHSTPPILKTKHSFLIELN